MKLLSTDKITFETRIIYNLKASCLVILEYEYMRGTENQSHIC